MIQIDALKRYEIGRLKKDSLDQPETGEYLYTPTVLTGEQLQKLGILSWNEFFEGSPINFQVGRLYHVFESKSQGERKLVTLGTITALKNPHNNNNLNDDNKQLMNFNNNAPHNIKFFKDQINEKNIEIKELFLKNEILSNDLLKAKEDKILAEQELKQHIGLNDAISAKEDEYLRAIEKAQKEQSESSNKVMEGIMALATQGLQMWLSTQTNKNTAPIQQNIQPTNNIDNMNDGDIVQVKNASGETEAWTVKTVADKKIIVSATGKMKSFN